MLAVVSLVWLGVGAAVASGSPGKGAAAPDDAAWALADAGWAVTLPAGFSVPAGGWSDWSLKAKHSDGSVLSVWVTPFQVPVSADAVAAWAAQYQAQLAGEAQAVVEVAQTEVIEVAGRPTGRVLLDVTVPGGEGVAEVYSVEGAGHTVHARVVTGVRKAGRARAALKALMESVYVKQGPFAVDAGEQVSVDGGFSVRLPEGWRAPLPAEADEVARGVAELGMDEPNPACVTAVRPRAAAAADLALWCPVGLHLDPVDPQSVGTIAAELHARFFGEAEGRVPSGEAWPLPDRLGVLFRPPVAQGSLRVGVVPYDRGMLTLWMRSESGPDEDLDAALVGFRDGLAFSGEDGGQPIIRADRWVVHMWIHHPTSPWVWGPVGVVVGLAAWWLGRRRGRSWELE